MSETNGDRARFHKNRKRKLRHRVRVHALASALARQRVEDAAAAVSPSVIVTFADAASHAASLEMHSEGAPRRADD